MRNIKILFAVLLFWLFQPILAQGYIKHTVLAGETITSLALKYKTTPLSIYELNPDAKNGISENTVLIIPETTSAVNSNKTNVKTTAVASKYK